MDILYLAYYVALYAIPIIAYIVLVKRDNVGFYSLPTWYYIFKKFYAKSAIGDYLQKNLQNYDKIPDALKEAPKKLLTDEDSDSLTFLATDQNKNTLFFTMSIRNGKVARILFQITLQDGTILQLPTNENFLIASIARNNWYAGGFSIEIVEPFKRCRISYTGFLKVVKPSGEEILENVKFSFIWNSCSKPLFYPEDFHKDLFTEAICREPWMDGNWLSLLGDSIGYEQYGSLIGYVSSPSLGSTMKELRLPCIKKRTTGMDSTLTTRRELTFFVAAENGDLLHFGVRSLKYGCTHLKFGSVLQSNGQVATIKNNDIFLGHLGDGMIIPDAFTVHIESTSKTFKSVFHTHKITSSECREKFGFVQNLATLECCINTKLGTALGVFWYQNTGDGLPLPKPLIAPMKKTVDHCNFVLSVTHKDCQILELSGGKGSSLALLKSLENGKFSVPDCFVVSTEALNYQLQNKKELQAAICSLETIARSNSETKLKDACEKITELFDMTEVVDNIAMVITKELDRIITGNPGKKLAFAVRSSGVLEDLEDISSAGQNLTVLGLHTSEEVLKAVSKSWGSLYSFNSVQYRRQHGLPIKSQMAVVVQILVPSSVAGVLFTCDPNTLDRSRMVITSNYGLGESVVSGIVEPDSIILNRSYHGTITVASQTIGSKSQWIVPSDQTSGTLNKKLDSALASTCSLTEEKALQLGEIGVLLESEFGNPRDIEWAFDGNDLYLLQSRGVSTLLHWNDYDVTHEFDTPVLSDDNLYTTANVGEVMPFASTTLTLSTITRNFENSLQYLTNGFTDLYSWRLLGVFNNQIHMDVINSVLRQSTDDVDITVKIYETAIFGHSVIAPEHLATARQRYGAITSTKSAKARLFWEMFSYVWNNGKNVERAIEFAEDFNLELDDVTCAHDLYTKLSDLIVDSQEICIIHGKISRVSIIYQILSVVTLLEGKNTLTTDNFHDIALMFSSCSNVISAEIPVKLEEIATVIRSKNNLREEFLKVDPKNGVKWMREHCKEASGKLTDFLRSHGHRSFRELELLQKTWLENPAVLIGMIQHTVKNNVSTKPKKIVNERQTVSQLKTSVKSSFTTSVLKFLIKKCRTAVARREASKCELVRVISVIRTNFYLLAEMMKKEGFLPDANLIFHLTFHEIGQLFEKPNPQLLTRAVRRRRLYPKLDLLRYPELSEGIPIHYKDSDLAFTPRKSDKSGVVITGTTVCNGDVTARACVIRSIDEIGQLKKGDVLITCSTDIAWTPYFPMLGGVVTELGGLISHGAVVAREYGLPCLVGVQNATKYFQTGDIVFLSSQNGSVEFLGKST